VSAAFEAAVTGAVEAALARWRASGPDRKAAHAVAVGWTTVELARAEASILVAAAGMIGRFEDAPGDALIGAHVRVAMLRLPAVPSVRTLALLEPSTEGRLARSLARLGEGPAVVWLAGAATASSSPVPDTSARAAGPFGPERLLLEGERDGRLILVTDDAPGTIAT
jgi:hypothetical protein